MKKYERMTLVIKKMKRAMMEMMRATVPKNILVKRMKVIVRKSYLLHHQ
jgi:hypothetical protein